MYDKRIQWIYTFIDTMISIVRMVFESHFKKTKQIRRNHDKCLVLGNGPSLLSTMKKYENIRPDYDIIAVNQMALTDMFEKYRPDVYVIADPDYWKDKDCDESRSLIKALIEKTSWDLQFYMPYEANIPEIAERLQTNPNIKIAFYNKTTFYGIKKIAYYIYNQQWGMVRPQTVLNAVLMLSIYSKYKTIYLAGADTDWMKDIWVDEQNRLRIHDSHFYHEDQQDDRILPCNMTDQCISFYYIFKNYSDIEEYSKYKKAKIYNIYPLSFIDAFEKIN